jgi:hypothetical protein
MYEKYNEEDYYGRGMFWFINASDDMVTGRNKPEADNIKNFNRNYIGGGYTESQWSMRYAIIKRAIIINVPNISMDEARKNRSLAMPISMQVWFIFNWRQTMVTTRQVCLLLRLKQMLLFL